MKRGSVAGSNTPKRLPRKPKIARPGFVSGSKDDPKKGGSGYTTSPKRRPGRPKAGKVIGAKVGKDGSVKRKRPNRPVSLPKGGKIIQY